MLKCEIKTENKLVRFVTRSHKVTVGVDTKCTDDWTIETSSLDGFESDFKQMIQEAAQEAWPDIKPKEEDSTGSDYGEMYDSKRDMNFGIAMVGGLRIDGYVENGFCNYDFNKRRMQSFLWDLGGA